MLGLGELWHAFKGTLHVDLVVKDVAPLSVLNKGAFALGSSSLVRVSWLGSFRNDLSLVKLI